MYGRTRREGILRLLAGSDACLSASKLAERFGVTRQVIVSDIALLRANGQKILATRLGYRLERAPEQGKLASVVCRHGDRQVFDEFCAVVDNGGAVLNVIVEHPLYGEICVELNVASRYDAQAFVERRRAAVRADRRAARAHAPRAGRRGARAHCRRAGCAGHPRRAAAGGGTGRRLKCL